MVPFDYVAAPSIPDAIARGQDDQADFIAGGTDMLQLLQEDVRRPAELVDIGHLPVADIAFGEAAVHIGALARLARVADDVTMQSEFPVVVQALLPPPRRRCATWRRWAAIFCSGPAAAISATPPPPCNRRVPGSGCLALDGQNRIHAILGTSEHCIATYPGDLAVALVALDARVHTTGIHGDRIIPLADLHRLPGNTPHLETVLEPGELITGIEIPRSEAARRSRYLKLRDRASFEWAIAAAAVGLEIEGEVIRDSRIAIGGVATKPWRLPALEANLRGQRPGEDLFRQVADRAADGARGYGRNDYKIPLIKRTVCRALIEVGGVA